MENTKYFLLQYISQSLDELRQNPLVNPENWFDAFYVMRQTFTIEEIQAMSDETVEICIKALNMMSDHMY